MREMHPIDERFKALYDAEATPPEEVRAAIGHRLGWNKPVGSGASFPSILLVLVGMAGASFAWYHWSDTTTNAKQEVAVVHEQHELITTEPAAPFAEATSNSVAVTNEATSQTQAGVRDQANLLPENQVELNPAQNTEGLIATKSIAGDRATIPSIKENRTPASSVQGAGSQPFDQKKEGGAVAAKKRLVTNEAVSSKEMPVAGSTSTQPRSSEPIADRSSDGTNLKIMAAANDLEQVGHAEERIGTEAWVGPAMSIDPLETRLSLLDIEASEKKPFASQRVEDYVIPNGNWWVSIYGGMSSVNGKWSGADAEALDRSEKWKSGWQAGAMAGRAWRSGFGVGIGAGVARIHSTFLDERTSIAGEATDLDTAWATSNYPGTQIPISTWFIDTTFTPIMGAQERTTANNQYTAIQVPLSMWWHKDLKRWKIGATAGVTGWIPMKRQGLTLVRPTSDAEPAPTALSSPETEQRYGMQLHGSAGLSMGYMLCEQLTILAEPMMSTPLYAGNENTSLSLSRPTIQLRLQYDLHSRVQRSK